MIDLLQIEQALINLLRNAIEAIGESGGMRGSIVIEAKVVDADFVEVRVADNGPGFPPELSRARFCRLSSTKAEGLGIGLPLCRSIVEAHGGRSVARHRHRKARPYVSRLPIAKTCHHADA